MSHEPRIRCFWTLNSSSVSTPWVWSSAKLFQLLHRLGRQTRRRRRRWRRRRGCHLLGRSLLGRRRSPGFALLAAGHMARHRSRRPGHHRSGRRGPHQWSMSQHVSVLSSSARQRRAEPTPHDGRATHHATASPRWDDCVARRASGRYGRGRMAMTSVAPVRPRRMATTRPGREAAGRRAAGWSRPVRCPRRLRHRFGRRWWSWLPSSTHGSGTCARSRPNPTGPFASATATDVDVEVVVVDEEVVVGPAGGVVADLGDGGHVDRVVQLAVTARGFSRCRFLGPEDASIGAVPLWRAK